MSQIIKTSELWEYKTYGLVIIAVDFDGTLCEGAFPRIGAPKTKVIEQVKEYMNHPECRIILWTCRVGERLEEALKWCADLGIIFDAVNDNIPEIKKHWGVYDGEEEPRKLSYTYLLDDKNISHVDLPFHFFDLNRKEES